jgi:hypothetical protein
MKPHVKVIQRNGVDIFVTSSMTMKATKAEREKIAAFRRLDSDVAIGGRTMGVTGSVMRLSASSSSSNRYLPIGCNPKNMNGW